VRGGRDPFDDSIEARKIRNGRDRLPEKLRTGVIARMRWAYHAESRSPSSRTVGGGR
jgi:hypothetical protein